MTFAAIIQLLGGFRAATFLAGALALAACLFFVTLQRNDARQDFASYKAAVIIATAKAETAARESERKQAAAILAATDKLTKENDHARETVAALTADLRSGALKLRERFTCPARVPGAAASPGVGDEAAAGGLSGEDAEFLVSEASRADEVARQLTACQAIIGARD